MKQKIIYGLILLTAVYIGFRTIQFYKAKAELPTRKSLIEKELDLRVVKYKQRFHKKCVKDYLAEAQEIADSLVFIRANNLQLFDSLGRPPKPLKPSHPALIPLKDSLLVKPLLEEEAERN